MEKKADNLDVFLSAFDTPDRENIRRSIKSVERCLGKQCRILKTGSTEVTFFTGETVLEWRSKLSPILVDVPYLKDVKIVFDLNELKIVVSFEATRSCKVGSRPPSYKSTLKYKKSVFVKKVEEKFASGKAIKPKDWVSVKPTLSALVDVIINYIECETGFYLELPSESDSTYTLVCEAKFEEVSQSFLEHLAHGFKIHEIECDVGVAPEFRKLKMVVCGSEEIDSFPVRKQYPHRR